FMCLSVLSVFSRDWLSRLCGRVSLCRSVKVCVERTTGDKYACKMTHKRSYAHTIIQDGLTHFMYVCVCVRVCVCVCVYVCVCFFVWCSRLWCVYCRFVFTAI